MIIQYINPEFDNILHTESDQDFYIRQVETGIIYETADDIIPCRYTYEETDVKIEHIVIPDDQLPLDAEVTQL